MFWGVACGCGMRVCSKGVQLGKWKGRSRHRVAAWGFTCTQCIPGSHDPAGEAALYMVDRHPCSLVAQALQLAMTYDWRWCRKCNRGKPPLSHHCSICNK